MGTGRAMGPFFLIVLVLVFHPWGQVDFVELPMGRVDSFIYGDKSVGARRKRIPQRPGGSPAVGPMTRRFVDWSILSTCLQGRVNFVFHPSGQVNS
jgi:hypothetical protein